MTANLPEAGSAVPCKHADKECFEKYDKWQKDYLANYSTPNLHLIDGNKGEYHFGDTLRIRASNMPTPQ